MSLPKIVAKTFNALIVTNARKATSYIANNLVVRVTRQFKPDRRNSRETVLVTFGKPNYKERKFLATLAKAKEPLPVRKIQLAFYPAK